MFRITFAEFIKVLKKPSIYIMGVVLAIAIIVSAFVFKPSNVKSYDLNLETNSAVESYNIFVGTSGSENKSTYDVNFQVSNDIIKYYTGLNTYKNNLKQSYDDIWAQYENLISANTTGEESKIKPAYTKFQNSVKSFKDYYFDFSTFPTNSFINFISTSETFLNSLNNSNNKIILLIDAFNNNDSHQIIEFIAANDVFEDIEILLNNGLQFSKNAFINLKTNIINKYNTYISKIDKISTSIDPKILNASKDEIITLLNEFKTLLDTSLNNNYPIVYTSKENTQFFTELINIILTTQESIFKNTTSPPIYEKHSNFKQSLEEYKFINELNKFVNGIEDVSISSNIVTKLTSMNNKVTENSNLILNEMSTNKNSMTNKEMQDLILSYKLLSDTYYNYTMQSVILNSTSNLSTTEIKKLYGYDFSNYNEYQLKENISRNSYYIKNNTYADNFLTPFGFNENSGTETNAYDFMYFALRISVILIIIFAIMMISSNITQEQDNGTIKLLLIRPFSRSKIINAKLLNTMIFAILFIIFASIISFISGLAMFGSTSIPVLCIFNASNVIQMSASSLMFINIICLIVEVLFFTIVSFALSTLFKSYAGSISTSLIIFILSLGLNILLSNSIVYAFIPFANIDFFKYFGGSFVYTSSVDNIFKSLLCTPIISNMTFWSSFAIYLVVVLILIAISHYVFRRRDF